MALRGLTWARTSPVRRAFLPSRQPSSDVHRDFHEASGHRQQQQAGNMAGLELEECVAPKEEVVRYIADSLVGVGASEEDARCVAHHLMVADYRGHFSHGLNRLSLYLDSIKSGFIDVKSRPRIVTDFQAIALVDGRDGLGQVIGKFCMELAIEKARQFGVGIVSAKGSNHYGICGYYSLMAMEKRMIGVSCTNTSPLAVPTRAVVPALGTNPLSLGMKASAGDEFVLDMATTAVALGKIELADRKQIPIPHGWAMDREGNSTTDPKAALEVHRLLPLGGEEHTSGYKGYGLALMVEVLCGVLSGSKYGPNIRLWKDNSEGNADLGHFFMAINPEVFGPGAPDRLAHLLGQIRSLPKKGDKDIQVAGDPERSAMAKVDKEGGIHYHENQIKNSEEIAAELGIQPMRLVKKVC